MILGPPLRAQSSVYGKIEQLLIVYSGDPAQVIEESIRHQFHELFTNFGDRVTFVILSNYDQELDRSTYLEISEKISKSFRDVLLEAHLHPDHHIVHIPAPMTLPQRKMTGMEGEFNHSHYIQDPFVVMQGPHGESVLMESFRGLNPKNQYVAEQVAAATGLLVHPTSLWIEGGNILVGNDFALIGKNLLYDNLELHYPGKELDDKIGGNSCNSSITANQSITGMFKRELGVKYLKWVGLDKASSLNFNLDQGKYRMQPFFHLDQFVTLGGMTHAGDELILLGKIDTGNIFEGPVDRFRSDFKKLNTMLKEIKDLLKGSGRREPGPKFEIKEIPMGGRLIEDPDGPGQYRFIPMSYNNCQVEWYHGVKRIYMPHYPGTKGLEEEIQRDLVTPNGFPPIKFIPYDFDCFATGGGSLRCLTKVLRRSSY